MMSKELFGIILLLLFIEGVSTKAYEERCKRVKHFRKHRSYWYQYEGYVENGIKGTSDKAAKMRISASLWIEYVNPCEYSLQMKDVKLEESFGDTKGFILSKRSDEAAGALQKFPLQFVMEYGLVTQVRPSLKERQKDILNIKRGILSSLQIKWSKTKETSETTVSGICDVSYKVSKNNDGARNISKATELSSCKERTMVHSNIESEQYMKTSSIYEEKSVCDYHLKKKNQIFQAQCEEYYLVKPFSSRVGAGSYSKIRQTFKLRKVKRVRNVSRKFPEFYTTSLLFDHKHEEQEKSADITALEKVLTELVHESSRKAQPGSANRFAELVFSLRKLDERGLGSAVRQLSVCFNKDSCNKEKIDGYFSYFFEALAQCGSTACVNVVANLIMTNKAAPDIVDDLISSFNFIQEPSTAMLNTIMGIHKVTSNPTALLSLGTLMHKLCKHRPEECLGNGPIANVVKNAEYYLIRILGNECRTKDLTKSTQMYYALKAIGNAGRPIRIKNIILDCVRHAAHLNTSIAAIQALSRMPLDSMLKEFLTEIISDRNVDIEKRMEAFLILMKGPFESDIMLAIDMVNDPEEAKQLRSFISSYLKTVISNQSPEKKELTDLFRKTLLLTNMTDFNPSAARFSKIIEKSTFLDVIGIGGSMNGKLLYHPESYIPRTIRLGFNGQALGHAVDVFEINARMEGLENEMGKLFANNGFVANNFIKNAFKIPNLEPQYETKSRDRRSTENEEYRKKLEDLDNEVNLKEPSPQLAFSVKIFGNEIKLLSLKDIPFLNKEIENLNIISALYSLTKGKSKTFRRSIVFMEGVYIVPTIVGLPLSFEMNGSAIISFNLEGKINAKNLIFGPKLVTLKGSIQPR